jgi:hypothetical protein
METTLTVQPETRECAGPLPEILLQQKGTGEAPGSQTQQKGEPALAKPAECRPWWVTWSRESPAYTQGRQLTGGPRAPGSPACFPPHRGTRSKHGISEIPNGNMAKGRKRVMVCPEELRSPEMSGPTRSLPCVLKRESGAGVGSAK